MTDCGASPNDAFIAPASDANACLSDLLVRDPRPAGMLSHPDTGAATNPRGMNIFRRQRDRSGGVLDNRIFIQPCRVERRKRRALHAPNDRLMPISTSPATLVDAAVPSTPPNNDAPPSDASSGAANVRWRVASVDR